jgi:hypothetical protein
MKKSIILLALVLAPTIYTLAQKKKPVFDKEVTPNTTTIPTKIDMPIEKVTVNKSKVEFNETTHDFGNIKQNQPVSFTFKFKNISKDTLTLIDVQTSCGCTTPEWSKDYVVTGKSGKITATYNAATPGSFYKTVTAKFKDGSTETLIIKGVVDSEPTVPATPVNTPNH